MLAAFGRSSVSCSLWHLFGTLNTNSSNPHVVLVAPVTLVIRKWDTFFISITILAVTSVIMKFTWWDRLHKLNE